MTKRGPTVEPSVPMRARRRHWRKLHWADVLLSAALVLVVAVPTMVIEEDWHGRPMIDQHTYLWLAAAGLVAVAFAVGGLVAGYRRPAAAATHAVAAATVAVAVLVMGAIARRLWVAHEDLPGVVAWLWCVGAAVALTLCAAGSLLGRRFAARPRLR